MIRWFLLFLLLALPASAQTQITNGWYDSSCSCYRVDLLNHPIPGTTTTNPAAITPQTASSALASNAVLKASAGTLYGFQVNNTTTVLEWVMLFNLTALPANGAVTPVAWWQVPAGSTLSVSEAPALTMSTGITVGCSTTGPFTLTASALCTFGAGVVQ